MNKIHVLFMIVYISVYGYAQINVKELSVKEAVRIGLENNPEIRSAKEKIHASEGRFWSGISLPMPEVSISLDFVPLHSGLSGYNERTMELRQSVEFPSVYFLKGNKLKMEKQVALAQLARAERRIINLVKSSYYKVLAKNIQVKYAYENVELSADFLKKAVIRTNVGEGTNLEKLTAEVQLSEAQSSLAIVQNDLRTAISELNYALGLKNQVLDTSLVLKDSLQFIVHSINEPEILKSIEDSNPEINIAKINSNISSAENDLAWSSLLPGFNFAYFRQSRDGSNGFYGASFGISVPLWFMFEQRGKITEAEANLSASGYELLLVKNEVNMLLRQALTDHENNYRQVKLYANTLLPQAEEIANAALKNYAAGEVTYLEFLQAKQILLSARANYINALYNHYLSVFKIEEFAGQNSNYNNELDK